MHGTWAGTGNGGGGGGGGASGLRGFAKLANRPPPNQQTGCRDPCAEIPLCRAIVTLILGGLLLIAGIVITALHYSGQLQGDDTGTVGPVLLCLGFMFCLLGIVWIPILRRKEARRQGTDFYEAQAERVRLEAARQKELAETERLHGGNPIV
ncbi:uncharacterized protein LOC118429515 [Branchiostoma floridae]|uniref:Uncharacterized protein LOC118429515 n=1 Tax=Branchiostoma floridae TaxID=7739 RepID=A0A9J7MB05_BRAFL|nr:uncharacterized protein LOC118429515 [Branchiostoma floridae]XP_035695906.1 uncharacterized protein LOC118429515 [Branchiostoma floridae]